MKPFALLLALTVPLPASAQESELPPGNRLPILRLQASGPTSAVTCLAFSPDGKTLYAGGYDKVIRTWRHDGKTFVLDENQVYRVPLGPGTQGDINALAISPDGKWLAVGGVGVSRDAAGFADVGIVLPRSGRVTEAMRRDQGLIYLFEREKPGNVRLLRGHRGSIRALAFAADNESPLLIGAAREWDGKDYVGRVRVWEVEKGKELAGTALAELPDPQDRRPGLSAWREQGRLLLAVAWQDSALRVWEVGKSEKWEQVEAGLLTDAVVHLDGRVLVSSSRGQAAHLGAWNVQAGPTLAADRQREKHVGTQPSIAIGLQLASSKVGGDADLAALLVRIPNRDPSREEYSLVLASLKDFGEKKGQVGLWTGRPARQPVLAATPGGGYLAVSGNRDHEILIYAIEDLLAGKQNLAQAPLRSEGRVRDHVAFVKNSKNEHGLAFSDTSTSPQARGAAPRALVQGDLIFNFASNRLSDQIQGWKLDAPDLDQWRVCLGDGITVEQNGRTVGKPFPLQRRQNVTQVALLPPITRKTPLLAVAYQELGQTNLVLFDVATGKDFRVLTGHVNPVRALAFSGDGRYLASAGEDQVVNVWSLRDLDQILGKQGLLRGLVIKEAGGKLAIAEIIDNQLNEANRDAIRKAGLQVDDTVEGVVSEGQLRALKSVATFYPAIWQSRPDSQVVLRTSRGDVTLTVDQGIDEHKPLFTLFVTRERQWIGWNPLGPYDVSDEKLQGRVGWHRNTGLPAAPTSFGPVALHRQEYYRRGILRRLFEKGDARVAFLPREAGDEPTLTVWIDELGPKPAKVRNNRAIIQKAPVTLGAAIDNLPPERLGWIRWQFNDGGWKDFSRNLGKTRKADLSALPWTRGEHNVQVVLRTHEVGAEEKTARMDLLFLPEPPGVEFPARWLETFGNGEVKQATVRAAEFSVLALIRPGARGEVVIAWLEHNGRKVEVATIAGDAAPTEPNFKQAITLQPGRNEIVVIARNKGALPGLEEYEEKRTLFVIHHAPVPLPRIVVASVAPAVSGGNPPRQGQSVKVREKDVQIRGTIAAETALTEATLDGQAISGFDRDKGEKTFTFRIKRSLEPGKNTLKFAAKAKESKEAEQELVIEYEPALPDFTLNSPLDLEDRPADRREIHLQGRLAPLPAEKATVQVLHGERAIAATFDARTGGLAANLTLDPGENTIKVTVTVAGKKQTTTLRAYVRRPPRIVKDDLPAQAQAALVSFTAEVHTPADLPLTDARLTGERLAERRLGKDSLKRKGGDQKSGVWTVSVENVPLAEGVENLLELWVKNADGEVRKTLKIQGPKKVLPRPVVTILDPRVDLAVDAENYTLKFKVESASPLTRLAVVRDGQDIKTFPVGVKQAEHALEVELRSGGNAFQVVAVNEGGETSVGRAISRVPDTVALRLVGLAPRGQGQPVQPLVKDGQVIFPRVPVGELRLSGQVVWPIQREELRAAVRIRIRVNGFEQPEVELGRAQGLHRAFAAHLKLNQAEDNIVELDFGPLKIDPATPPRFRVARCDAPLSDQRLHLIAIAAGDRDLEKVSRKILTIFNARDVRSDRVRDLAFQRFQADGFKECRLYGPLPSDVSKDEIYRTLRRVNELIRAERFPANEVVGVYFQGQALLQGEEYYLLTHESLVLKNHRRSALTVAGLRTGLDENLGAHLLLMDVVSPGGEDVPMDAFCASCVGVFHYAWLKTEGVTEQDRLLDALGQAMSRGKVLREIHRQMESQAKQTRQKLPALVPLNFVPQEMAGLRLGRER